MGRVIGWLIGLTLVVMVHFVPGGGLLRVAAWVLLLGALVAFRASIARTLAGFFTARPVAKGGTKFVLLPGATDDASARAMWAAPQEVLTTAGFAWVGDCRMRDADFPHSIRLMQRHQQTFASLVHLAPDGQPALYCELFTPFTDGSTATTTSSRFGSNGKRPPQYAMDVLPPDTPVAELLAHHDGTLASKTGRVRDALTVATLDELFELWGQVEKGLHEFRNQEGVVPGDKTAPVQASAAPGPGARTSPSPANLVATEERQASFRSDVVEALHEAYPELLLEERGPLELQGRYRSWQETLDLARPFAEYLDDPVRRSFIIASFVSTLGTSMKYGAPQD